jgi:hypothetical protein
MNAIEDRLDDKTKAALLAFRNSLHRTSKVAYADSSIGTRGDFSPNLIHHPNGDSPSDVLDNH